MKWVLCGDLHLTSYQPVNRTDDILNTSLAKFHFILETATELKAPVFIAGDTFDRPRDWLLLPEISALIKSFNVPIYAVWGQHDMYMRNKSPSSTLGVLSKVGLISILRKKTFSDCGWTVHGCSWGDNVSRATKNAIKNALVIHAPIAPKEMYPGQQFISDRDFMGKHPFYDLILCGDTHHRFICVDNKRALINCGPMVRVAATMYNLSLKPAICLFDTDSQKFEWKFVPIEPNVFDLKKIETKKEHESMLADFISSVAGRERTRQMSIRERVEAWIKDPDSPDDVTRYLNYILD